MLRTTLRTAWKPANYPKNPHTVGEHIRRKRMDLGLQVKELATQFGADEQSVSGWELGHRQPSLVHLSAVIHWLGYDPRPKVDVLADRLKRHRTALGFSLKAAAEQIGVDPGTLTRCERGRRQPEGKYLARVYSFLGEDPRPAAATIAERLKRCREALGWSQRELARRIGVYPSTVERWELGQRKPGVGT